MRTTHLLAFVTPLVLLLPMSAQADAWPKNLKAEYMQQCVAAASQSIDSKSATKHCACGAKKIEENFTTAEIKTLMSKTIQPSAALRTKALDAIQICRAKKQGS